MNNDDHVPEGCSRRLRHSDDMSEWLGKSVNYKLYAPEDDLQHPIDDKARDIALIEQNPVDLGR
jgi:hypothetical protein